MMGNLFYRGARTVDINEMDYFEMKDWNHWHDLMSKAEKDAAKPKKRNNGR